jgi:hypothetical protein
MATVEVALLGPIPMPLALLGGSILVSAVLGWLLGLHAGWVGRRVARDVGGRVESVVRDAVTTDAFATLGRLEEARTSVAAAIGRR